jgi:hypothetical protein
VKAFHQRRVGQQTQNEHRHYRTESRMGKEDRKKKHSGTVGRNPKKGLAA